MTNTYYFNAFPIVSPVSLQHWSTTVAFKCAIQINLTYLSLLLLLWLLLILKPPFMELPCKGGSQMMNVEIFHLSTRGQSFAIERPDWSEFYICLLFSPYFYISAVFNHRNHYCGRLPGTTYGSVETGTIGKLWHMLLTVQTKVCRVDVTLHLSKVSTGTHTSATLVLYVTGKCCVIIPPDLIVTRVSCEVSTSPPSLHLVEGRQLRGFLAPPHPLSDGLSSPTPFPPAWMYRQSRHWGSGCSPAAAGDVKRHGSAEIEVKEAGGGGWSGKPGAAFT